MAEESLSSRPLVVVSPPANPPTQPPLSSPANVASGAMASGAAKNAIADCGSPKVVAGCKCQKCEAKRKEWRDKDARRRGKTPLPAAVGNGAPAVAPGGPPVATVSPVASSGGANVGVPAPLPWTADIVRPGLSLLMPSIEKADVASLKEAAAQVSPAAVQLVGRKAAWSDEVKHALTESGSAVLAKWLGKSGISAEFAPELTLIGAVSALLSSRSSLKAELAEMAADAKQHRAADASLSKVRDLSEGPAKP